MTTDFRAELECLVKAYDDHGLRWPDIDALAMYRAVQKARAALSAPEQGPTDEELYDCWMNVAEQARLLEHTLDQPAVTFARAVLARWGRPAVEPVTDGPTFLEIISTADAEFNSKPEGE